MRIFLLARESCSVSLCCGVSYLPSRQLLGVAHQDGEAAIGGRVVSAVVDVQSDPLCGLERDQVFGKLVLGGTGSVMPRRSPSAMTCLRLPNPIMLVLLIVPWWTAEPAKSRWIARYVSASLPSTSRTVRRRRPLSAGQTPRPSQR